MIARQRQARYGESDMGSPFFYQSHTQHVQTMPEAGVDANFPGQWWAIIAPKGTPAAIIKRIKQCRYERFAGCQLARLLRSLCFI